MCLLLYARIASAAAPCAGDCNSDGLVGIAELIVGVQVSLSGDADPCGADLDDDGRIAVNELVRLVSLALRGCPLPFDANAIDGVYDADARGQTDPSGGFNKRGLALVASAGDGLEMDVHFGPLETLHLQATVMEDGSVTLTGDGVAGGEFAVLLRGVADLTQRDGAVELRGVLDFEFALLPVTYRLDVVFARPVSGTAAAYSGVQRFTLRHPMQGGSTLTSQIDLPLTVPASGRATCGATADVEADAATRAELPESPCLVSATGRFLYAAPYRLPGGADPLPLHLTGTVSVGDGTGGRGTFWVAEFPAIAESGVWQAAPLRH